MRADLVAAVDRFLAAGRERSDLRADADAADVAALLAGVLVVAGTPGQVEQAARMVDLVGGRTAALSAAQAVVSSTPSASR
jgi:crotonobetainyl-CoA:carnitine CoA-transferase CaiB-like acyl-CoA transferase